jgi:hypothetical protein
MPKEILISEAFNYSATFIISLILLLYEYLTNKNIKTDKEAKLNKKERSKNELIYIYNDAEVTDISYTSLFIIIFLLFLSIQLKNLIYIFSLKGLDYWIFEILFVCYINYKLFGTPAFKHKKYSICFIIIFCAITKTISLKFRLDDPNIRVLYKSFNWIICIGISISFILITFLRPYTFCKVKWFIEIKFFSPIKILVLYGLIGAIICFSISIISNGIPCVDENTYKDIHFICKVNKTDNDSSIYYYDNYSAFFSSFGNALYVVLYIIQIITSFGVKLFSILIIKFLSPEYYICSNGLYYFIVGLIDTCIFLFKGIINGDFEFKAYKWFEILADFFHFLGSIIYLELIELKFFGLDYYLKKNIDIRSRMEVMRGYSLNDINDNDNDNSMNN